MPKERLMQIFTKSREIQQMYPSSHCETLLSMCCKPTYVDIHTGSFVGLTDFCYQCYWCAPLRVSTYGIQVSTACTNEWDRDHACKWNLWIVGKGNMSVHACKRMQGPMCMCACMHACMISRQQEVLNHIGIHRPLQWTVRSNHCATFSVWTDTFHSMVHSHSIWGSQPVICEHSKHFQKVDG